MHVARRFQPLLVALLIAPALNAYPLQLADDVVPEQTRNGAAVISSGDDQAVATRNTADSAHVASTDADIDGSEEPVHLIQSREGCTTCPCTCTPCSYKCEGQSCGGWFDTKGLCASGLQCISDETCVKVPTAAGEACGAGHGGLTCAAGLQCQGNSVDGVCEPLAKIGDPCGEPLAKFGVPLECDSDLGCSTTCPGGDCANWKPNVCFYITDGGLVAPPSGQGPNAFVD